jgi:uncharacterized protein (DUF2342 family)
MVLGVVAWYQGDPATSTRHQEEAFAICRKSGDDWMASKALVNLADMAEAAGDYERAAGLLADALGISRTMHDHVTVVMTVESVAEILHRRGDHSRAARLLGACATFRAEMVLPLDDHETSELAAVVAQVRDATGERIFEQAWNDGCRLPLDDAIDEASAAIEEASVAID